MAMEEWAKRHLLSDDVAASTHANAMQLGGVKVLESILDVELKDIEHFYELTGGVGEFKYQAGRKDGYTENAGLGAPGETGSGGG